MSMVARLNAEAAAKAATEQAQSQLDQSLISESNGGNLTSSGGFSGNSVSINEQLSDNSDNKNNHILWIGGLTVLTVIILVFKKYI